MYQFSKWVHATEDLKIANLLIQGVVFKLHVAVYLSVCLFVCLIDWYTPRLTKWVSAASGSYPLAV